ncbi:MAG: polysaccharide biosynthesis protein [Gaiellaceae bacterium]
MIVSRHRLWQVAADAVFIAGAWYLAFWLRFDLHTVRRPYNRFLDLSPVLLMLAIKLAFFVAFGFYNRWWRYVSTRDIWVVVRGVTFACVAADLVVHFARFTPPAFPLPRAVAVVDWLLLLAFVAGSRLLARTLIERPSAGERIAHGREVIVVGAGDAANVMLRELHKSHQHAFTPIGLIDDDPRKQGMRLQGVKVLGTVDDLPHILRLNKPDEVLIAMPTASGERRRQVVETCRDVGVAVKTLPDLYELISGELAAQIRPVQVEDVLGREPVSVDFEAIAGYLAGQTVAVTGAGGTIGSELCRQIARVGPSTLLLIDQAETPLFEIERELVNERGFANAVPVLASVGRSDKIRRVFEQHRPAVVFHAAAYKHVPMMEANPLESVRNNVLATRSLARVASETGVERFVLISTDKAVNPQTVMGQSKALCEWIIESFGQRPEVQTRFVAVRFGNVLGSSGSVVPIFRREIARGGPVRVTDPEMTRFFMTIPEAVSLVVQAGSMGENGRVFVLDMGKPVRILDLAQNMIRLSGKEPGRDIQIEFIGVRPGEKLHEELIGEGETAAPTSHPKILELTRFAIDPVWLDGELGNLAGLVAADDGPGIVKRLNEIAHAAQRLDDALSVGRIVREKDTLSEQTLL